MGQVVACFESLEFRRNLDAQFRTTLGIQPILKDSAEEVTSLINILPDIDVVIVESFIKKEATAATINDYIAETGKKICLIVVGEEDDKLENATQFFKKSDWQEMLRYVMMVLGITPEHVDEKIPDFISMPAELFVHFKVLPHDLYIRILSRGEKPKFVKRIPANEEFDRKIVDGYIEKGGKDFYFPKEFRKQFSALLTNNMIARLEGKHKNKADKIKAEAEVLNTVKDIVQVLGIKPQIAEVCDAAIKSIENDLKGPNKFYRFLEGLKHSEGQSFHYQLVQTTALICSNFIEQTEWAQRDKQLRKLVFCSFFCDIMLTKDYMLHIRTPLQYSEMAEGDDKKRVYDHAFKASELVRKNVNSPLEADRIILNHHCQTAGLDIADKIPTLMTPLSSIFFLCQEFAYRFLVAEKKDLKAIFNEFYDTYIQPNTKEHLNKLKETLEFNK